jgi:hypothetical protein
MPRLIILGVWHLGHFRWLARCLENYRFPVSASAKAQLRPWPQTSGKIGENYGDGTSASIKKTVLTFTSLPPTFFRFLHVPDFDYFADRDIGHFQRARRTTMFVDQIACFGNANEGLRLSAFRI